MSLSLPQPVAAFFQVSERTDASGLEDCFAVDAVVADESHTHRGHEAIRSWLREAQKKYAYKVEPLSASQDGPLLNVRAKVTGSFPGSPIELIHAFKLTGNRISSLEIHP